MNNYTTIDADYPDLESYKHNLKLLSQTDFSKSTYDEIYNTFHDFALTIPLIGAKLKTVDGINGHRLYRARLSKNFAKEEDISLIQTFSFPPPTVCESNQRANIKFKSVFYCADEAFPAIIECGAEDGDEGYLSVWEINGSRDLHYANCFPEILPKGNTWEEFGRFHHNFLIESQSKKDKNLLQHKIALRNLVTHKFMKEKKPYYLSSMLANEYLYESNADLIMYPSAQTFQDYTNFAFHPNIVSEHLKCYKIFKFKVIKRGTEQVKFNFKSIGHIENDRINWKKPTDEDGIELGFRKE
jgi:hypothetical protein